MANTDYMVAALPNARYERKLTASGLTLSEVVALVQRHPAGFRQAYPERAVNNIYLDSPSLTSYHQHVNGAPNRVKTRVRWYGAAQGPVGKPALEYKLKAGQVSGKFSHTLPALQLNGAPLHGSLAAAFDDPGVPDAVRANVRLLEPALFNRYRRRYYVSADRRFRLTVDWDLQFARLGRNSIAPRQLLGSGSLVIVELKYLPQDAERVAAITKEFPFRVARCSKYVLGIERSAAL